MQLLHYEHRKTSAVSASPAAIRTASKHLHNDLARAIEALEQKKNADRSWCGNILYFWLVSKKSFWLCAYLDEQAEVVQCADL